MRIGFPTCEMWLVFPTLENHPEISCLEKKSWCRRGKFKHLQAFRRSLKCDYQDERRVGSVGFGSSKYTYKSISFHFLKKSLRLCQRKKKCTSLWQFPNDSLSPCSNKRPDSGFRQPQNTGFYLVLKQLGEVT